MARRRSGGIYKLVYYNTLDRPRARLEASTRSLPNRANIVLLAFSDCYQPSFGLSLQRNYPCFVQVVDRSRLVEISYSFREQWSVKIEKKHSMAGITLLKVLGGGGELRTFVLSRFTALLLNVLGLLFSAYCNYSREKTNASDCRTGCFWHSVAKFNCYSIHEKNNVSLSVMI